jgi:hypothetical protein
MALARVSLPSEIAFESSTPREPESEKSLAGTARPPEPDWPEERLRPESLLSRLFNVASDRTAIRQKGAHYSI